MRHNYLTILAISLILATIIQGGYLILEFSEKKLSDISGEPTGEIKFCIGQIPQNITTDCPSSSREGVDTYCYVDADIPGGGQITFSGSSFPVHFTSFPMGIIDNYLTVTPLGAITFRTYNGSLPWPFSPEYNKYYYFLGNHTITLQATNHCGDSITLEHNLTIFDQNDPPFLNQIVPNRTILRGATTLLFNLKNYFHDPENKVMSFTNSPTSNIVITTLTPAGDVLGFTTTCVETTTYFTATDSGGLNATSNTISITVNCPGEDGDDTGGDGGSGGSGSGGSVSCISDWQCGPWTRCTENGTTTRTCIDQNACNPNYYIHRVEMDCTYIPPLICDEIWECGEWNDCQPNNKQSRRCEELNGCGTEETKPLIEQDCEYQTTCTDFIQNQGETGIDCGGPCLPCKTLQVPGTIRENKTIVSTITLLAILALLSALIVYKYFHKQINAAVVAILLKVVKKRKKRILLTDDEKKYLLEKLLEIELKITKKKVLEKSMETALLAREYFAIIFKTSHTLPKEELTKHIKKYKIKEPLNNIFTSFFDKISLVETTKIQLHKNDIIILIEEMREIIHQTSKFKKEDVDKEIKEVEINDDDKPETKIKKLIHNTYIAMQFDELDICKDKYSEIIQFYEELPEDIKGHFYYDIERLFNEIKYLLSTHQK